MRVGPDGKLYVQNGSFGGCVWRFELPGGQSLGEPRPGDRENVYDIGFAELTM